MSRVVGHVADESGEVVIFAVDPTLPVVPIHHYYWCCNADGACSQYHTSFNSARDEAIAHICNFHKEVSDGQEQRTD